MIEDKLLVWFVLCYGKYCDLNLFSPAVVFLRLHTEIKPDVDRGGQRFIHFTLKSITKT